MRPDGSGVRRLTHQPAYTPAWSPDGEHIVFSAPGLFVANPDGTGVTPIPTDEIAEKLGCSTSTVFRHVHELELETQMGAAAEVPARADRSDL
jgi:hypothetical protein